jgi:surface antigen
MKIRIAGKNANQYFSTAIQRGLIAYTNGGSEPPKVGDILCFGGGPKDANGDQFGHVALITEVSGTRIRVSQQNVGISTHINFSFERKSGNIIDPTNLDKKYKRFFTQGWLRKP